MHKPVIGIVADRTPYTTHDDRVAEGVMDAYVQAVSNTGGIPIILPISVAEADIPELLGMCQGLLLTGGHDIHPHMYGQEPAVSLHRPDEQMDGIEMAYLRTALGRHMPVLGICRGMQLLNVALGGTLLQDIPTESRSKLHNVNNYPEHPLNAFAHEVTVVPNTRFANIVQTTTLRTNSRHHQGVKWLSPSLTVNATAPDGLIEGVEIVDHPFCIGVQWHPENLQEQPEMRKLFADFVVAAQKMR